MFETLIGTSEVRPAWKSTVFISLLAHVAAVILLILLPLMYFQVVDCRFLTEIVFAEPVEPVPPSPPPQGRQAVVDAKPSSGPRVIQLPPMTIPPDMPTTLPDPEVATLPYPEGLTSYPVGPVGSGVVPDGVLELAMNPAPPPKVEPPPPPPKIRKPPILVSTISPGGLIHRVEPVYPPLAIAARVQGPVKLQLLINEEGVVQQVTFMSGPTLLSEAAITAVKQWRYRPTILNGEPVPVQGTVIVSFILER